MIKRTLKKIDMGRRNIFISTIKNELSAVFGDAGAMLLIVFAILIYTVVYSVAYGREVVTDVVIGVVNEDNTPSSRRLIDGLRSGPNTKVGYNPISTEDAEDMFYNNDIYGVVYIPSGYERSLLDGCQADVAVVLDGSHLLVYRQVLQQAVADILATGANVEVERLVSNNMSGADITSLVQPVVYDGHVMYNPSLGYGSFVMPSILIVIIQQTLFIGLALINVRRRDRDHIILNITLWTSVKITLAKIIVYIIIYGISLTIILGVVWPIFGFPYAGQTLDVVVMMTMYIIAATSLGLSLSHLFRRREAPFLLLLWSSVPILLLAGLSLPKEAFPGWLYAIGELLPSSSAVRAFVEIGTMGASLSDTSSELLRLTLLGAIYLFLAIVVEKYCSVSKKIDN